jgi:hypothetical protein
MARKRISYAWALKLPEDLSVEDEGLIWARFLARQALEWRREAPRGNPRPYPFTITELARELALDRRLVGKRIADARSRYFGSLSDSGIYARLARERQREELTDEERVPPACKAPDCENTVPWKRTARRQYCHSRCRRRHHYQRLHPGSTPAPHLRGRRRSKETLNLSRAQLERVDAFLRARSRQKSSASDG